jgi:hypothetical protein
MGTYRNPQRDLKKDSEKKQACQSNKYHIHHTLTH